MKISRKLLAIALSLIMVLSLIPSSVMATNGRPVHSIRFATMSDIHIFPQSLTPERENFDSDEAYEEAQAKWLTSCRYASKQFEESEDITRAALRTFVERAEDNGTKYLLLSGDLTKDSELEAHRRLAELLREEVESKGIQVITINGNHDVNTTDADDFSTGSEVTAEPITPRGFIDNYRDLGYDLAAEVYGTDDRTPDGNLLDIPNELSYVVELDDYTQLIVVDSNVYSFGQSQPQVTEGEVSDDCLEWICAKADNWAAKGRACQSFVMIHHNMVPHMECEPSVTHAFVLNDYLRVAETFADHNIHYTFSGHLHQADLATLVNDNGQPLTDCETASLTGYPNTYRENEMVIYEDGTTDIYYENVSFDAGRCHSGGVAIAGETYPQGEFEKLKSFGLCYGGAVDDSKGGVASGLGFAKGLIIGYGGGLIAGIKEAGGLLPYIKEAFGLDLEKTIADFLEPYIGSGIRLGSTSILSVDNIMWFLNDLAKQIEDNYLGDINDLWNAIEPSIEKLMNFKVSDVEVTPAIRESIGIGHDGYSTLEDILFSTVYYWDQGNELTDIHQDALLGDVTDRYKVGISNVKDDNGNSLFDVLIDVVFNDILDGMLLSKLQFNLNAFFSSDYVSQKASEGINYLIKYLFKGDYSYRNIVNTVFGLGVLPYSSIFDIVDQLLIKEYWTDSQDESIGVLIAKFIIDFATDDSLDYDTTCSSAEQEVPVTTENFRKPTMVSVTLGDTADSANINWFSKYTLPDTDVVIYDENMNDITSAVAMTKSSEQVEMFYPGIDIGIIGFFKYFFNMYRHTVTLTGLDAGATYYYKVGNAGRGWWSDTGRIRTQDGGNTVTFLHTSDPQSQSKAQYERGWASLLNTAFTMFPEADFVACTGDLVDYGKNNNMWQWMFDTASSNLLNTYLMPVTGNHENFSDYSTVSYFTLPNVPEQDLASGVYYSYDYNNVHIAVMNANNLSDSTGSFSDDQIEWLRKDMNASDAQWKIVATHKALYSNGSHYDDDEVVAMREQFGWLLPELGVDMVIAGHDHVYLRTYSLKNNEVVDEKVTYLDYDNGDSAPNAYKTYDTPSGVFHSIAGCSGVKYYIGKDLTKTDKYFPRPEKIYDAYGTMFSAIQIRDGVLYYNAYEIKDGKTTAVDQFAIRKDTEQGSVMDESEWPPEDNSTAITSKSKFMSLLEKLLEIIYKVLTVAWNLHNMYADTIKSIG